MLGDRLHRQPEKSYTRPRYVVQDYEVFDIISREHVYGVGHAGRDKTWAEIDRQYYGITKNDVKDLLKHCASCALTKPARTVAPLESIVVDDLWERLQIDLIDYRHFDLKYKWCLHIRDHFSKFSAAFAMENKESETVAFFLGIFIGLFGAPGILQCDNGTEFKGACQRVIRIHGIPVVHSRPQTPQTNGLIEQANAVLKEKIRCWMNDNQSRFWWLAIPECIMAMNRQVHGTTGKSPYEVVFKQHMGVVNRIPADVRSGAELEEVVHDNAGLPLIAGPTDSSSPACAIPTSVSPAVDSDASAFSSSVPNTASSFTDDHSPAAASYEELQPHSQLRRMLLSNVALRIENAHNSSGPYYDWFGVECERDLGEHIEWDNQTDEAAMLAHFGPGSNGVDEALWALAAAREPPGVFAADVAETERKATIAAAAAAIQRARKVALPALPSSSVRGPPPPLPPRPSYITTPPRRTLTPPTPPPASPPLLTGPSCLPRSPTPAGPAPPSLQYSTTSPPLLRTPTRPTLRPRILIRPAVFEGTPTPPAASLRIPSETPLRSSRTARHSSSQAAINERLHREVRERTARTRKAMELRHNTVRNVVRFAVGDLVRLKIPAPDKNTTDNKRIFCRIIAIPHEVRARYQLLCEYGILKGTFATKNMDFLQNTIPNNIPTSHIGQPTLTLRAAAHLQSETDIRQVKCACKASCNNIRCRCFKAKVACTLHCHGREPMGCCVNLREGGAQGAVTGLENLRVEPRLRVSPKRQRVADQGTEVDNDPPEVRRRSKRQRGGVVEVDNEDDVEEEEEEQEEQEQEEEEDGDDIDLDALDLNLYDI